MIKVIIFFDTETTGLIKPDVRQLSEQPFIIEYCFKKVIMDSDTGDIQREDVLEGFLKPPMPLPKVITKITGITDEDLVDAPVFIDRFDEIANFFLGTDILVAHNLPFDRSMLANELLRVDKVLNFPWPKTHICTVEKTLNMNGYRLSLTKLYAQLFNGEEFKAHRAGDDVNAMHRCFTELYRQGIIKFDKNGA